MGTLELLRRGGCNEYPQSMFWIKNKENIYTPVNSSFAKYKWGIKGYTFHGHVFLIHVRLGVLLHGAVFACLVFYIIK